MGLGRVADGDVTLAAAGAAAGAADREAASESATEADVEASNAESNGAVDMLPAAGCTRLFLRDPEPKRLLGGAAPNKPEMSAGRGGRLTGEPLALLPAMLLLAVLSSLDSSAKTAGTAEGSMRCKEP